MSIRDFFQKREKKNLTGYEFWMVVYFVIFIFIFLKERLKCQLFCYQQFFLFSFFHKQHNIISKIKQNKTADT